MQIEVSKNELSGALSALGKLVCRTAPVELFRSLLIEGKGDTVAFQTTSIDETITCAIPAEGAGEFRAVVNFDEFRTVVRYGRNKSSVLAYEDGKFAVDNCAMRTLDVEWPEEHVEEKRFVTAELPGTFIPGYLAVAAPIVDRNGYRMVLRGIHLCKYGVVVTNGKELLHIDLPLPIEDLTIPFPHALLATKCEDAGRVVTWCEKESRYFRFEFGKWRWSGKALVGNYPDWHRVIPEQGSLTHIVDFDVDRVEQMATFLKGVPDNPPNNPIVLSMGKESTLRVASEGGMQIDISATFLTYWGDLKLTVNKTLLLRLLNEGHHRIAIANDSAPFIATGGIGRYIAMPLAPHNKVVQPQTQPKEESQMNESIPNVAAPLQPVTPIINTEPAAVNPLDELAAAIDEFKARLRAMFDESTLLSRKVKEVALANKQKERDFVQAKRTLERIRMAI